LADVDVGLMKAPLRTTVQRTPTPSILGPDVTPPTGKVSASPDGSHTPLVLLASQRTPVVIKILI
jgi:hypothetical protein